MQLQPRPRAGGTGRVGDCGGEAASRYLVSKFRLTDEQMVAQLQSILEGNDAQTAQAAQPTAAPQSSPAPVQLQPAPAREELAG